MDDAEDAYQRGLEILLTKAPTTREEELVPWLRTVVKHEALAIRRQRERAMPSSDEEGVLERAGTDGESHERVERWERLRHGAEALKRLKPHEVQALLMKAEGYSYEEIGRLRGWSYTNGTWSHDYEFEATTRRTRYRFRARLPREAGVYPFEVGNSRTVAVVVSP